MEKQFFHNKFHYHNLPFEKDDKLTVAKRLIKNFDEDSEFVDHRDQRGFEFSLGKEFEGDLDKKLEKLGLVASTNVTCYIFRHTVQRYEF